MITIYAEKFDVGVKIAAALGGFDYNGTTVTMNNIEKLKTQLDKDVKRKGSIRFHYEGEDYAVTWGQGHMCGLKQAKDYNSEYSSWYKLPMPFFPDNYEIKIREGYNRETRRPTGEPDPWTERQLDIVRQLFEESTSIINATDDDREGEVIFAYVYECVNVKKPYSRVVLDSQTEEGFRDAFKHLKPSREVLPIENAGRCRSIADWMVGANLSALMSLKYGGKGSDSLISIGRVQTPVLNILVERELEIKNFVSKPFWNIQAKFMTEDGDTYVGKYKQSQIEDKAAAEAIIKKIEDKDGTITSYEKDPFKREVPFLYNLTSLSMDANAMYGMTAQETLNTAQDLYTAGYLTYPRTVSQHLTSDMQPVVDEVIDMLAEYSDEYGEYINSVTKRNYTKRHFDTSKVNSHYAIIPTKVNPGTLTGNKKNIYDLVAKSLIRIIFKAAEGEKTKIITTVDGEEFQTSGKVILKKEWLVVGKEKADPDLLPVLSIGDIVAGEYQLKEGKTEPPKRYTDKTLLSAMRTAGKTIEDEDLKKIMMDVGDGGIGTEATRAGIIETVIARRYAERAGGSKIKQIVPTEKGMKLIEILPLKEITSAELTADWETRLKKVEKEEESMEEFIKDMEAITRTWVEKIQASESNVRLSEDKDNETEYTCPKCGKKLKKLSWGWACSGYQKGDANSCNFAIGYEISGVKVTDNDIISLLKNKRSKYFSGFKKKDSKDTYGAYLIIDENGNITRTMDTGMVCPKCGKHNLMNWGKSISCPGYKEGCTFTIWNKQYGKVISETDKIDLIKKGKTKKIKGFVKKDGSTYESALILNEDYEVKLAPFDKKK